MGPTPRPRAHRRPPDDIPPRAKARSSRHRLVQRIERRNYAARRYLYMRRLSTAPGPPIVVYSVGKTGTTAIADTLYDAGFHPVLQVHNLRPRVAVEAEAKARVKDGQPSNGSKTPKATPHYVWESLHLTRSMPTPERPWLVVTSVRDPIKRNIAHFFQAGEFEGYLDDQATVESLLERFGNRWDAGLNWFESNFRLSLGFDVLDHPFDPEQGYQIVDTPRFSVLLLRQESLAKAPVALAEFLGLDEPLELKRSNVGDQKSYASLYRDFLAQARPPRSVVERVYGHPMVQHFYSPAEIAAFRDHWLSVPDP